MRSRWHVWFLFMVFVVAVLSAMGWLSARVVRLQEENVEARRKAAVEQLVRLALWKMDAAVSSLILEESSRPYSDYWAYNVGGNVYDYEKGNKIANAQPSPLLSTNPVDRNLYFQADLAQTGKGKLVINSPQVIEDETVSVVDPFAQAVSAGNKEQLGILNDKLSAEDLNKALEKFAVEEEAYVLNGTDSSSLSIIDNNGPIKQDRGEIQSQAANIGQDQQGAQAQQLARADDEYRDRKSKTEETQKKIQYTKSRWYDVGNRVNASIDGYDNEDGRKKELGKALPGWDKDAELNRKAPDTGVETEQVAIDVTRIHEDIMRPIWVQDLLILARKVRIDGKSTIQGVWLNWDSIKKQLLAEVSDTFPYADLVKADPAKEFDKSRLLASLPVKLVPGEPANAVVLPPASLFFPLTIAWVFVIIGVVCVGGLIAGISVLSERRGAFVSAVTHELRTPLTTLRMYTEMLAEGMIKEEKKKGEYLESLRQESNRLGHLVENVLAYAGLEKGVGSRTLEPVSTGALMDRMMGSLNRRADEVGMTVLMDISEETREVRLKTDVMAVEQILFNMVDNACKYASHAEDKRIHVALAVSDGRIYFRVSDHGHGLKRNEIKLVFQPFRKSAEKAAQTAPGVGLGLALCRRLARQLGGDVSYEEHSGGAYFLLELPCLT